MRLAALVAFVFFTLPALAQPAGMEMPPPPVEVTVASHQPLFTSISAIGSLTANESVVIRPEMPGLIKSISFEEGQPVKKGDPLLQLEENALSAEARAAQSSARLGSANLERERKLKASGYTTQRALDEARTTAAANRAEADVAKIRLNKTIVRAPFDGIAGLRQVSLGDYVNTGQNLVNLEQIDPMKLNFSVPEVFLADLKAGMPVEVQVDAYPGEAFSGVIYAVDPKIDMVTRTIAARARIDNPDGKLRPGLFARVSLPMTGGRTMIVVPETALVPEGSKMYAWRIVDNKAQRIEVKMGQRNAGMVEVVDGLQDGDTVIVTGQMRLMDGGPVNIVNTIKPKEQPVTQVEPVAPAAELAPAMVPGDAPSEIVPMPEAAPAVPAPIDLPADAPEATVTVPAEVAE
ncbi:MAG: efflux RND transporter periplasmic adaptor subunit [Bdellovibrionales bacterium]